MHGHPKIKLEIKVRGGNTSDDAGLKIRDTNVKNWATNQGSLVLVQSPEAPNTVTRMNKGKDQKIS
jgi:hypothetical protein